MKPLSAKRMNRIEKKKKKMAALLEITKLNEFDRANKCLQMSLQDLPTEVHFADSEPSPKRLRTEEEAETPSPPAPSQELGPSGKPKLDREEYLQLKKLLKENSAKMRVQPTFRLREFGEAASIATELDSRIPIFMADIQHLVMYSQLGPQSPYTPARWCQLEKYTKLINTTVFVVENLSAYHFISNESLFPYLSSNYTHKLEVVNSGAYKTDIVQDFLMVPLTNTQMRRFINQYGSLESAVTQCNHLFDVVKNLFPIEDVPAEPEARVANLPKGDRFPRTELLLSGWQLIEENFPLPVKGLMERKYVDYVLTKDRYEDVTITSPMFGLDCEMCKTVGGDLELTRVSIVNEKLEVFYEQLVKPERRIVDYLTQFSGITSKMMKNVTKRLAEVQEDLRKLLPSDAILVGQSLSNDMHALKMMHPYVIDTSVIFNITGERNRKTKLQTLSREFLSERIQESKRGHCSVEDSLASLKLAQLKLAHSIYYGDAVMSGFEDHIRKHPQLGTTNYATSLLKQATKIDKTASLVASAEIARKYRLCTYKDQEVASSKIRFQPQEAHADVVKNLCETSMQFSLNVGHIAVADAQLADSETFRNVDAWVQKIAEHTSTPGLSLVVFTGSREGGNGACFIKLKRL